MKLYTVRAAVKRLEHGFTVKKHRYSKASARSFKLSLHKSHKFLICDYRKKRKQVKVEKIIGINFGNECSTFLINGKSSSI